ncbi:ferritin-like domain-containing protein [Sphingorhabdus sp. Alg239-R122]|uniref:ferritin-like domain-containing protein n=1 Tax=Sphingorhabdus sp. Alg239-R122 TaxID=2305989 RepID=UPI001F07819D|nr:ferritin-like domain-containing protein [Sphingorhabdus sp. Alg239-R122]
MTTETTMPTRRNFIGGAGKTLSLAGLAMISGGCSYAAAPNSASATSQDVEILNAAIALEHEGIAAYQIAATSGLLQPAVVDIGVTFQGHHKGHRDALIKAVEQLGGTPVEEQSQDHYIDALDIASLKNQEDVLRLALKLERGAANAYLGLIPSLGNDFHQVAAQMAGDEAFHAAILGNALGEPIPKTPLMFG